MKLSTIHKSKTKKDFGKEKIELLYEDEYLCVINKSSGLLSVPYPGSTVRTAQSVLEEILRKKGSLNKKHKPFVVHRLDRDTSGVMMFALSENIQKKLMDNWHQIVTERLYRAVAENPHNKKFILPEQGLIDDELAFNAHNMGFVPKEGDIPKHKGEKDSIYERHIEGSGSNRRFKTVSARTHYKMIFIGPTHTLFELELDTGKKNQIRAHLASKNYPLAGDENYRAKTDPFKRLCLHARTLEFIHPVTNEKMKFEVPESQTWLEYVKKGDPNAKTPIWIEQTRSNLQKEDSTFHKKQREQKLNLGSKPLSRKQKSHMNFIEQGKIRKN